MDDWLQGIDTGGGRHLEVLRDILSRGFLREPDWDHAQRELAGVVESALGAEEVLVALWDGHLRRWSATERRGSALSHEALGHRGVRSALDEVRGSAEPMLSVGAPHGGGSGSAVTLPLFFADTDGGERSRRLVGCVQAQRSARLPAFTGADIELGLDLVRLAEPVLGMLRRLEQSRAELAAARLRLLELQRASEGDYRLGDAHSRDGWFGRHVLEPLRRVSAARKVNILIQGPSGSGKGWLARAFHAASARRAGPFVVLDCAQVSSCETLTAELFGAAAPGRASLPGKALLADGGTLFIREVGALPLDLQQKLLRLIEAGSFCPPGSGQVHHTDLQVLAATCEDLRALAHQGRFIEGLLWRLGEVHLHLPPLDDRLADVPQLARLFLDRARAQAGREDLEGFSEAALHHLLRHPWHRAGNIRGLSRTILRTALLAPPHTELIEPAHLALQEATSPRAPSASPGGPRLTEASGRPSKKLQQVIEAIRRTGYATAAAKELNISYRQLTWQLHKVGLSVRDVLAGD